MSEIISVPDLYRRVAHRLDTPRSYVVFTGFTGRVTRKAALMKDNRQELWVPLSVMRARFLGEIETLPESFAEYEFSAPPEVVRDARKFQEERDQRAREQEARRYPT